MCNGINNVKTHSIMYLILTSILQTRWYIIFGVDGAFLEEVFKFVNSGIRPISHLLNGNKKSTCHSDHNVKYFLAPPSS